MPDPCPNASGRTSKPVGRTWTGAALAACLLLGLATAAPASGPSGSGFAGSPTCGACHPAQAALWAGSHHDLAMQEATAATVLGDFEDAAVPLPGATVRFTREGGAFMVHAPGPDGITRAYEVAYTFGVDPLQQYLVAMPGGRLQALHVAWDSRPAAEGGQRWFALYPESPPPPGDPLHWTGPYQTWNSMCADCHSTDVRRGFDAATDTYETTWFEIDVGCEACHGPGAAHAAWAADGAQGPDHGLGMTLGRPAGTAWILAPGASTAQSTGGGAASAQLDACALCHARRRELAPAYAYGRPLLDSVQPALLEEGLYHPDGQILGEVYEAGSFQQSRMAQAGVVCSDCHEPHSLTLRADGNGVCAQCHRPSRFDVATHHRHEPGQAGSRCVDCHMPARTYMEIDVRHDHAIRVPRPALSARLGTPDPCTTCHAGRDAAWASAALAAWGVDEAADGPHYGDAIAAARRGAPGADRLLIAVATDAGLPAIVRATAVSLLPAFAFNLGPAMGAALKAGLADTEDIVRLAAVEAVAGFGTQAALPLLAPLLTDPVLAVRARAGRALAAVPLAEVPAALRRDLQAAWADLAAAERATAERPGTLLSLGAFLADQGRLDDAQATYEAALGVDPSFAPALVNLADLDRLRGRDADGLRRLQRAIELDPDAAEPRFALGLLLVRMGDTQGALAAMREASDLAPEVPRYAIAQALALNGMGLAEEALAVLQETLERHPGSFDALWLLALLSRDRGDVESARRHAARLTLLAPNNPDVRSLFLSLSAP